jgi:hypothetical protein
VRALQSFSLEKGLCRHRTALFESLQLASDNQDQGRLQDGQERQTSEGQESR